MVVVVFGPGGCTVAIDVVMLGGGDKITVFDYFDIVLGEDIFTFVIAELSNLYE